MGGQLAASFSLQKHEAAAATWSAFVTQTSDVYIQRVARNSFPPLDWNYLIDICRELSGTYGEGVMKREMRFNYGGRWLRNLHFCSICAHILYEELEMRKISFKWVRKYGEPIQNRQMLGYAT